MSVLGKAVVIVGMPRSGTASVAGALSKLGVFFGDSDQLQAGDEYNEAGYWEHNAAGAANRKFLASLSQTTLDVDPLPADWRERPMTEALIAETIGVWSKSFEGRPLWGMKDPQASNILPFVRECFKRVDVTPSVVICVRNPLDVAASSLRRQGAPISHTLGGWLMSTLSALRDSRGMDRSVIVFSRILGDPKKALEPAVRALGLDPTPAEWTEAIGSVNPEVSHGAAILGQLDAHPPQIKATYELCLEAEANHAKFIAGGFAEEVERLWAEWGEWRSFFSRPAFAEATLQLSWNASGGSCSTGVTYGPTSGWQVVTGITDAAPNTEVSVMLYPLPAQVWVRKAVWKHAGGESPAKISPGRDGVFETLNGTHRISLYHGPQQLTVQTPPEATGKLQLQLDILVETNNAISESTFQTLSERPTP